MDVIKGIVKDSIISGVKDTYKIYKNDQEERLSHTSEYEFEDFEFEDFEIPDKGSRYYIVYFNDVCTYVGKLINIPMKYRDYEMCYVYYTNKKSLEGIPEKYIDKNTGKILQYNPETSNKTF